MYDGKYNNVKTGSMQALVAVTWRAGRSTLVGILSMMAVLVFMTAISRSSSADALRSAALSSSNLSVEQQRIAEQYRRLEEVLLRMAELNATSNPRRAELLRKAVSQSKERLIAVQFDRLVELLDSERLSLALEGQGDLQRDLVQLLELLLSENRERQVASKKARIRGYLKQLDHIIRGQKALEGRTENADDLERIARDQGELSQKTGKLLADINSGNQSDKPAGADGAADKQQSAESNGQPGHAHSGKPKDGAGSKAGKSGGASGDESQSKPEQKSQTRSDDESDSAIRPLQAARERMQEAQAALEKAQREGALAKQEEALRRLEEAKTQLEKILRQLREEEIKQMLKTLQARFENMLKLQQQAYKNTLLLEKVPRAERSREHEIAAGRLADKQSAIVLEADKVLLLLKEDGTAVAFPEVVIQARDDMKEAAGRLVRGLTGRITQAIEEDIMAALEEMIDAMHSELEKLEEGSQAKSASQSMQQDPALIAKLAELKMIRSLQLRVNRRTAQYGRMIDGEEAHNAELLDALRRLAQREAKIEEITRILGLQNPKKQ